MLATAKRRGWWKNKSKAEVSERMAEVVSHRHKNKTPEERREIALDLVAARGTWKMIKGKRVYVKNKRSK